VLLAGTFVNRVGAFVQPFLALYLAGPRELTPSTVGTVVACFGLGSFASQPIGGYLADRVGRRATLVASMIGTAAAFMLFASARTLALIAVAAMLAGLVIDAYRPAVAAMVADLVRPEHRPRAFALLYWAINLGVAVAGVAGGFLAARSYWLLFVLDAATCLVFAVLIVRFVPETHPRGARSNGHDYGVALRDRTSFSAVAVGTGSAVIDSDRRTGGPSTSGHKNPGTTSSRGHSLIHSVVCQPESDRILAHSSSTAIGPAVDRLPPTRLPSSFSADRGS
jgi:MFS family permease